MAYSTTYATLRAELMTYVEDDSAEYQAQLDNIIQRGLDAVVRLLDLDRFRSTLTTHIPQGARTMTRQDALKIRSLFLTKVGDHIQRRSFDFCRAYQGTGVPLYWCERDTGTIYLAPTPDMNYALEIEMLMRSDPLSALQPTNWVTDNVGDLLLLACLIESEQFLAAPERVTEFMTTLQAKGQQYAETFRGDGRTSASPMRPAPMIQEGRI